jgi:hypothetical protein
MLASFRFADGTKLLPSASFVNETSSGLYREDSGDVRMAILTQDVMRWQTSGVEIWDNVLLQWFTVTTTNNSGDLLPLDNTWTGTNTFNNTVSVGTGAATDEALCVAGDVKIDGGSGFGILHFGGVSDNTKIVGRDSTHATSPDTMAFSAGSLVRMLIDGDGYVEANYGLKSEGAGADSFRAGTNAGETSQAASTVAIGKNAGQTTQGSSSVAIGNQAGFTGQLGQSVAVGYFAGQTTQGSSAIAIGNAAGATSQGNECVAIGYQSGYTGQVTTATAVGRRAGYSNQSIDACAFGNLSGYTDQGNSSVAVGRSAGQTTQGDKCVAVGLDAAKTTQGNQAVAVGYRAGYVDQLSNATSIGPQCGYSDQGTKAVAIGYQSGYSDQAGNSIAIGSGCGRVTQGASSVSIGVSCGNTGQMNNTVAIGNAAGQTGQLGQAIGIGLYAGQTSQQTNAIAIGNRAGQSNQHAGSIIISSVGSARNSTADGDVKIESSTAWLRASGANWTSSGATGNVSDIRLKENVEPITDALAKVNTLNGITFSYIENGVVSTGLIAQEVQAVLPEAIIETEDGHLALAYGNMVGLLVESIKELTAKVEALEA